MLANNANSDSIPLTSTQILSAYLDELQIFITKYPISQIRILGSFGRSEGRRESDLDVWIVLEGSLPDLDDLAKICKNELKVRKKLSKRFGLVNFARHKASIFSKEEAFVYEKAFSVRVGLPRVLDEQKILFEKHFPEQSKVSVPIEDIVVSLREFRENYRTLSKPEIKRKWLRRIVKEMVYFRDGIRLDSHAVDSVIREVYFDDFDLIDQALNDYLLTLRDKTTEEAIERRMLLHNLMWTLEKVRWEVIDSYGDTDYFEKWRLGSFKNFGFTPFEISELVIKSAKILRDVDSIAKDLGKLLIAITRQDCSKRQLMHFHDVLSEWLLRTCSLCMKEMRVERRKFDSVLIICKFNKSLRELEAFEALMK